MSPPCPELLLPPPLLPPPPPQQQQQQQQRSLEQQHQTRQQQHAGERTLASAMTASMDIDPAERAEAQQVAAGVVALLPAIAAMPRGPCEEQPLPLFTSMAADAPFARDGAVCPICQEGICSAELGQLDLRQCRACGMVLHAVCQSGGCCERVPRLTFLPCWASPSSAAAQQRLRPAVAS